jgi:hypothetical protein
VVGSLVLVIMVLGASAGAYALTRTSSSSPRDGSVVQVSSTPQPADVPLDTQLSH